MKYESVICQIERLKKYIGINIMDRTNYIF
jgi:hypothetical protein